MYDFITAREFYNILKHEGDLISFDKQEGISMIFLISFFRFRIHPKKKKKNENINLTILWFYSSMAI